MLIYINDILITGSPLGVQSIITNLQYEFAIKDLGNMHYFLGVEAILVSGGLYLYHHQYIYNRLDFPSMLMAKPVSMPMSTSSKLTATDSHSLFDATLSRNTIGSFQYLTLTHLDVSFVVICQYIQSLRTKHWTAIKYILRYLK